MDQATVFLTSATLLLALPGPTNILLATAGARDGWGALPLVGAALAGYSISISILLALAMTAAAASPLLGVALQIACAGWVALLAVAMWRAGSLKNPDSPRLPMRDVFVATTLNPKGLIFAVALAPVTASGAETAATCLFGLAAAILLTGTCWTAFGTLFSRGAASNHADKASAVAMSGFAAFIAVSAVT